jgi:outer membrane protein assembly factor BamB
MYFFAGAIASSDPWNVVALDIGSGRVLWQHSTGGTGTVRPVVGGDTVYATIYRDTPNAYHQGFLDALDTASGALRWEHPVAGPVDTFPAVANGLVYLSVDGTQPGGSGTLEALRTADGTVVWHADVSVYVSSPAVVGGVVYLLAGSEVLAFDAQTGTPKWSLDTGSPLTSGNNVAGNPAPFVAGGMVYAEPVARAPDGTARESLIAINADTGALQWSYSTAGFASQPVADGALVYVTGTDSEGSLHSVFAALDVHTGVPRWTYASPLGALVSDPAVDAGRVYLAVGGTAAASVPGMVLAFDGASGHQIWHASLGTVPIGSVGSVGSVGSGVLVGDGLVGTMVITATSGIACLAVLNATDGSQRWCKTLPAWGSVSLSDGVLYTSSRTEAYPAGEAAAIRFADGVVLWHYPSSS